MGGESGAVPCASTTCCWTWTTARRTTAGGASSCIGWCGWRRQQRLTIELAYYPPYHSKYNPIERCWGVLEVYWNGELLDSEAAVLGFAGSMTYGGKHPRCLGSIRRTPVGCVGARRR